MSGSPETLDVTSDGIIQKGSTDNEGREVFLKILPSKRRFSFAPFNSTNFSYYKRVMLLQTNFLSSEKCTAVNSDYINNTFFCD
jgi:hypothetical protein